MQLSPHFSLAEFTFSDTANAEHIANTPNARHIGAMKVLCAKVLEPLRAHFGQPVRITSGFRTPRLCVAVGRSEEHTSELQSLMRISYAVFCLKTKKYQNTT